MQENKECSHEKARLAELKNVSMLSDTEQSSKLLGNVVKLYDDFVQNVASHGAEPSDGRYRQPYVYLTTHLICMQSAGWKDIDFETLTTVSGVGLMFAYNHKVDAKCEDLIVGMGERIAEATGFGFEWVSFEDAEDAWNLICETIDSGKCVKGWHLEKVIFAGYKDAQNAEGRQVFAVGDPFNYILAIGGRGRNSRNE